MTEETTWTNDEWNRVRTAMGFLNTNPYRGPRERELYDTPAMYQDRLLNRRRDAVLEAMDLFERHPPLATRSLFTLHIILAAATCVDLQIIQRLHNIYGTEFVDKALIQRNRFGSYPLHLACWYCSGDVIEYLAKLAPYISSKRNRRGMVPLHCMVGNRLHPPSLSAWKFILEWYPPALDTACFGAAFSEDFSVDFLELLVDEWLSEASRDEYDPYYTYGFNSFLANTTSAREVRPMKINKTHVLSRLLPSLEFFSLLYRPGWEKDSIVYFLAELKMNTSLKEVTLGLQNWMVEEGESIDGIFQKGSVGDALQQALLRNTTLESLKICVADSMSAQRMKSWLNCLQAWLGPNQGLRFVGISFAFPRQGKATWGIPCDFYYTMADKSYSSFEVGPCAVELSFSGFDFSDKELVTIFQKQPEEFGLPDVELGHWSSGSTPPPGEQDLTTLLKGLMKESKYLQSIELYNLTVDISSLLSDVMTHECLEAFAIVPEDRDNPPLMLLNSKDTSKCLDLLERENGTLMHLYPWDEDPAIRFQLILNEYGRGALRKASDQTILVDLITYINHQESEVWSWGDDWVVGLMYGLLRYAPSLWCQCNLHPTQSRKRKLPSSLQQEST